MLYFFDCTVLEAVEKVQARIEELRQSMEDRQQLELEFSYAVIAERPTGTRFSTLPTR